MWNADPENIDIDTRSMFIASQQAVQWLFVYFTFFTHCDYMTLTSHVKNTVPLHIYCMVRLIYNLGYQTKQISTGFVSVAISGGFGEYLAILTGLTMLG